VGSTKERGKTMREAPDSEVYEANYDSADEGFTPLVRDLMTEKVVTLFANENLKVLDMAMEWMNIRHIPVVDSEHRLQGLVTHRDLLKVSVSALAGLKKGEVDDINEKIIISDIMQEEVRSISPDATLGDAAEILATHKFGCLPVVENEKLVGIITEADFVKAFVKWDAKVAAQDEE
jgi:CBS domain-containing membrane protein